jgi:hypothetical protein
MKSFFSPRKSRQSGSEVRAQTREAVGRHSTQLSGGRECFVTKFLSGEKLKQAHASMGEVEMIDVTIEQKPEVSWYQL